MLDSLFDPSASPLEAADLELMEAARAVLLKHYKPFWHTVGAALRTRGGQVYTGVHLGATVGRLSVCAEAIALGRAVLDGDGTIECAVAMRHPKAEELRQEIAVVPPCGACREMLVDFDAGGRGDRANAGRADPIACAQASAVPISAMIVIPRSS